MPYLPTGGDHSRVLQTPARAQRTGIVGRAAASPSADASAAAVEAAMESLLRGRSQNVTGLAQIWAGWVRNGPVDVSNRRQLVAILSGRSPTTAHRIASLVRLDGLRQLSAGGRAELHALLDQRSAQTAARIGQLTDQLVHGPLPQGLWAELQALQIGRPGTIAAVLGAVIAETPARLAPYAHRMIEREALTWQALAQGTPTISPEEQAHLATKPLKTLTVQEEAALSVAETRRLERLRHNLTRHAELTVQGLWRTLEPAEQQELDYLTKRVGSPPADE